TPLSSFIITNSPTFLFPPPPCPTFEGLDRLVGPAAAFVLPDSCACGCSLVVVSKSSSSSSSLLSSSFSFVLITIMTPIKKRMTPNAMIPIVDFSKLLPSMPGMAASLLMLFGSPSAVNVGFCAATGGAVHFFAMFCPQRLGFPAKSDAGNLESPGEISPLRLLFETSKFVNFSIFRLGILPENWLLSNRSSTRLGTSPREGGISPENLLFDSQIFFRAIIFEKKSEGISPENWLSFR
ncbi:hypothetical protein LINPERPRIM_LOCUS19445, partial [Linum perenne]